jgi:cell cycle serine/threonine-protein kinase CDC5/MSD2
MARALLPPSTDPEQAKFAQRLLDKLKYCKEVLLSIRNASAGTGSSVNEGGMVSAKASLR